MKHLILSTTLILMGYLGFGQCSPNPKYTQTGYYSSAGKNKLPQAYIHVPYEDTITIIAPKDTTWLGNTFQIDSITLVSITGLPDTLSYSAPTFTFYGGTPGCVKISGTPGKSGNFPLVFDVVVYVKGTGGVQRQENFEFQVLDTTSNSTETRNRAKQQISIAPNPVREKFQVLLGNLQPENLEVNIHNLVGEKVYTESFTGNDTQNPIWISTAGFPPGIYIYSIATPHIEKSGRLIITE